MVAAHGRSRASRCRGCGRVSTRVHSRYRRRVTGLPVAGQPVVLCLTVRRFFCDQVDCPAGTFVEQVPGLTEKNGRRSIGLHGALAAIELALAGRAGSRLAGRMGIAMSRSTLLRVIRGLPDPQVGR
ncbi:transposase family protein [Nakamurella sp. GG22]